VYRFYPSDKRTTSPRDDRIVKETLSERTMTLSLRRLQKDEVYRWYLASPLAFEDWTDPQADEFNANPTNDPNGLIWNISCALDTDTSQFDLDEPDSDDSLTFCQSAGNQEPTEYAATIVHGVQLSKERWTNADGTLAADGFNTSTLAQSLLTWRGIEYFAILSVGKDVDAPFEVGDRIKMAEVATDWGIIEGGSGEMLKLVQTHAKRSRLLWNHRIAA
jgi:hypothetical protein